MTATASTLDARVDQRESVIAIHELIAGYCVGLMHAGNREIFLGLWHPDAEYLIPGRDEYHGLDRIAEAYDVIFGLWHRTWHWTANESITFSTPDRAEGRVDVFAFQEKHDRSAVAWVGSTYVDRYERRAGQWRFSSRTTRRWFVSPALEIPLPSPSENT